MHRDKWSSVVPYGIIRCDVNDFKSINEGTAGKHEQGDAVLQELGQLLRTFVDEHQGIAFRTGGDEFTLFVGRTTRRKMKDLTASLKTTIAKHEFSEITGGSPLKISMSVGDTVCTEANERIKEVCLKAEQAQFKEKEMHREQAAT